MINIKLNQQDLLEIKGFACKYFMDNPMPKELDSADFLVLCYAVAMDKFLNKRNVPVNINFTSKRPYEPVDE